MTESDEQIYSRYLAQRNGDDFRILLERHRESLTLFLCSFVHNPEDAEELTLDAYFIFPGFPSYRQRPTCSATAVSCWPHRIRVMSWWVCSPLPSASA